MFKDKPGRTVELYVDDIIDAIKHIEKYTKGMDGELFEKNNLVFDATMKNLLVIGEALKNFPPRIRDKYNDIPWRQIIGMRNKLIHEYFGINRLVVWATIEEDVPLLKKEIKKIKKSL